MSRLGLNHAGDTIVEVMIVLAILGSALGIAYATANDSLLATRQAEEATTATELAQSQVELLRSLSDAPLANGSSNPPDTIYNTEAYCVDSSRNIIPLLGPVPGSNVTTNQSIPYDTGNAYPTQCTSSNSLYHVAIGYDQSQNDLFTVRVVWDDVHGDGQDTVTLVYRLHPKS